MIESTWARLQGRDEGIGIEGGADAGNVLGGVEVEMDLPIAQRLGVLGVHVSDYSLVPVRDCAPAANWRWKTRKTMSGTMVVTIAATERRSQLRS